MNTDAINDLAVAVWRRVINNVGTDECCGARHDSLPSPEDCGLYSEIYEEITSWASARTP